MAKVTRREVILAGAAAGAAGCAPKALRSTAERPRMRTPLCDLLGIEYPILQSGMGSIAGPSLCIEVSKAGGLGAIGTTDLEVDEMIAAVAKVREGTDRPFALNLLLPDEFRNPPPIDAAAVHAEQARLNPFRTRLGIPTKDDLPEKFDPFLDPMIDAIVKARPAVFSCGQGIPSAEVVKRMHDAGIKVTSMVTSVEEGQRAAAAGADVVIAQGWEAGGHRSHASNPATVQVGAVGTIALVREMVTKLSVPVVAAGGISDGRGMAAALALGAAGVLLGTRFVATREAKANDGYKKTITSRTSSDTVVTNAFSGRFARMVRNELVDSLAAAGTTLAFPWPALVVGDVSSAARKKDDLALEVMLAGQGIGALREVVGAGEVVAKLVSEAREAVRQLRGQLDV